MVVKFELFAINKTEDMCIKMNSTTSKCRQMMSPLIPHNKKNRAGCRLHDGFSRCVYRRRFLFSLQKISLVLVY